MRGSRRRPALPEYVSPNHPDGACTIYVAGARSFGDTLVAILGRSGYRFALLDGKALSNDAATLENKIAHGSGINVIARLAS